MLNLTDQNGISLGPLPNFISFNETTLEIQTIDSKQAGVYYLIMNIYFQKFGNSVLAP